MIQSLMTGLGVVAQTEGENLVELPMSPVAFGLTALAIFALALLATYSFRNIANRHNPSSIDTHGHGQSGQPGTSVQRH